jgi:hypothetical protein
MPLGHCWHFACQRGSLADAWTRGEIGVFESVLDIRLYSNNYSNLISQDYRLGYREGRELLWQRLAEAPPSRVQLLAGPRQVGKTTLLIELADGLGKARVLHGERRRRQRCQASGSDCGPAPKRSLTAQGRAVILLDEAHLLPDWAGAPRGRAGSSQTSGAHRSDGLIRPPLGFAISREYGRSL